MLLGFIILYLLGTLAIGWWASRKVKTTKDFVVAGKNLPVIVAASALFATWFGSETIMGASSEFVEHGLLGVIEDPFGAALCLFLVGFFFARPLYELDILTFNDFFKLRFGRKAELISALFMIPSYFGWIAAQLVAMAIVLHTIAGLPVPVGIAICTGIVLVYTYIGGMWAVSVTDFVQTIMILVGLLLLTVSMLRELGDISRLQEATPEGFFRFFPERGWQNGLEYFAAWITIGLGSIPQQDVFQRVMGARSAKASVRASHIGGFMYLIIGAFPLFIGLCGKVLYPELQMGDPQMVIPTMVLQHASIPLQILFFGALLSAILSTTSGAMLAPATVIGENVLKPILSNPSDRQLLLIMRMSVVGVAVISAVMANLQSNIYELVGQSSALSLVGLFVPLTAGLYWKRSRELGALLSIVIGTLVWLACEIAGTETPSLLIGFAAGILAMIAGSYLTPAGKK